MKRKRKKFSSALARARRLKHLKYRQRPSFSHRDGLLKHWSGIRLGGSGFKCTQIVHSGSALRILPILNTFFQIEKLQRFLCVQSEKLRCWIRLAVRCILDWW